MAAGNYVLAMTSLMDTDDGFERLEAALLEIDARLSQKSPDNVTAASTSENVSQFAQLYTPQEQVCTIAEALDSAQEAVELKNATGRIVSDYIYLYPPGIPLLAPGERITEKAVRDICLCLESGFTVHGLLPDEQAAVMK